MLTVIRKTTETISDSRREVMHAIGWQVHTAIWNPPTDVYETEQEFIIRTEVAGMREEDFEVSIQNSTVLITGTRLDTNEKRAYHQMEIQSGKFIITVDLPHSINIKNSYAKYHDGFLIVTLPKENSKNNKVK